MNIWKHVPGAMPIILAACTAVCTGVSLAGYQEPTFASSAEETTGSSVAGNETPSDAAPSPTAGGEKLKTTGNTKTAAESSSGSATVAASGDPQTYKDGVYTGSAQGYGGTTTVRVTVSGGKITDITVLSENDTDQFFSKAKDPIIKAIIAGQNPDVDTVSGATYSSNGIINAVKNALAKAPLREDSREHLQAPPEAPDRRLSKRLRRHPPIKTAPTTEAARASAEQQQSA